MASARIGAKDFRSESKSNLRIQAISRQLAALIQMVKLQLKRGVRGEIDSYPRRRTIVGSLQQIYWIVHVITHVLIPEVRLVDSERPGDLGVSHRAPERLRRSHDVVA